MIIGDLHIGHRNGDKETAEYQLRVFEDFILPTIAKYNIKRAIQTGDFFDSRKAIRHDSMQLVSQIIAPKLKEAGVELDVFVGNHDMHMRESIYPNSVQELLSQYDHFHVHNEPKTVDFYGTKIDLIPWICRNNRMEIMEFIRESDSKICAGHFELAGFEYYRGIESSGESRDFLNKYQTVWSGHFHCMSKKGNVQYVGTPYQLTFGDADDDRGVWLYDTDTGVMEFVSNGMPRFSRIYYDADTFDTKNLNRYAGMFLRLIVKNRGDAKKFEKLIAQLAEIAKEIKVHDTPDVTGATSTTKVTGVKTVAQIIEEYIGNLEETDQDKAKIRKMMAQFLSDCQK